MNVAESKRVTAPEAAQDWLARFAEALQSQDAHAAADMFLADGLWRDVLAFTWTIETMSGRAAIEAALRQTLARTKPANFHIPSKRTAPRWVSRAGTESIEAIFEFETAFGPAHGIVRLVPDPQTPSRLRAWTLLTALQELRGHEEAFKRRAPEDSTRDFGAANWLDRRNQTCAYADRDPTVIVVGGGQAGLSIAARLQQLGVDTLIVDRHERIGDNWRKRYHSLTLHNEVHVNHLPYMPFPPNFPVYIPKDKLANWFESYVEAMELNFWTGTELAGGSYDDARKQWSVTLRHTDGSTRVAHPRHLIFATGVSSIPTTPDLPGLAEFGGTAVHSGAFKNAEQWRGKKALGARHRHQRPRRRAGTTRARRRRHHDPAQQDLRGKPAGSPKRLRDLFRRYPVRRLRPAGGIVSLPGAATLLSALDRERPRGRPEAARRARQIAASGCSTAKTKPVSR